MIEGHENKNIYVMETTIEGAQKRITNVIEIIEKGPGQSLVNEDLEYIAVFLDSVGDEMAAITSSCNSLHARYVEALANVNQLQADFDTVDSEAAGHLADKIKMTEEIDRLREENEALRKGNLNNLHAAHDNR